MDWEPLFHEVAEVHEGLIARFHLAEIGCTTVHWWQAVRTGRWLCASPRVLQSAGAPKTESQRVLAAVLDASPGAFLHHGSALAWLGLRGFHLAEIDVARPRDVSGMRPSLARLHQLRSVRAHDVRVVRGVVTETALRAIWCEAARFAPERLQEIGLHRVGLLLDEAHRLGLVTWEGLHEIVEDIRQRGRSGTVIMRQLAEERAPGSSPTESRQENQFEAVLEHNRVRPFRRQRHLGGQEPIGRCDFADDELPLAVEVNSLTFHTAPTDRAADERRYQALMDAGFTIAVIWEDDVWKRPAAVVRTVSEARGCAARRRRVVVHSPGCPWPRPRVGEPS